MKAHLCSACKQGKYCYVCCIIGGSSRNESTCPIANNDCNSCAACGSLPLDSSSSRCTVCGVKLCGTCNFLTRSEKQNTRFKYTCIACLGADLFYERLRNKAKDIHDRTDNLLSGRIILDRYATRVLFVEFCELVDVLNRLLMFATLKDMWPLLLRIVKYQEENGMEGHLGTLQVVRFHVEPRALHSELVRQVALLSATWTKVRRPADSNASKPVQNAVPTLGFALYDLHGLAPILQLLSPALHQLLSRAVTRKDISVHILAVQSPNLEISLVSSLHRAFSAQGCWHTVYDESGILPREMTLKQLTNFRRILRRIGITAIVDCIGSSADGSEAFRGLCRPGSEARCIVDFLNSAALPWDSHCYSGIILDPTLSLAVPREDPGADKFWNISCWQPPMTDSIRGLNRNKRTVFRHGNGQRFGIHTPVDLTRISEECLEQLLDLLLDLPDSMLCYYGSPLTQVISTMNNMKDYAVKRGRDENYFKDRVDWWGHYPIGDHGQRMRDKVHVCLALGPSTDTGVNVALCVGVPVATEQGLDGGGEISSWGPPTMLRMCGLGALAVPNGSRRAGDLVRQLYWDPRLLTLSQNILDHQAQNSIGFFNNERTANDLAALATAVHESTDSNPPAREFISCLPEPAYFLLDQAWKLQRTSTALVWEGNCELDDSNVLPALLGFEEFAHQAGTIVQADTDADREPSWAQPAGAVGAAAEMLRLLESLPPSDGADLDVEMMTQAAMGAECEPDVRSEVSAGAVGADAEMQEETIIDLRDDTDEPPSAGDLPELWSADGPVLNRWTGRRWRGRRRGRCWPGVWGVCGGLWKTGR